jgi:pimeloyl-ACP methyl ester carboxylesterase
MTAALKSIQTDRLEIAYAEAGPTDGPLAILMHGFPYDIHCFDEVATLLAAKGVRTLAPFMRGYGPTKFLNADTMRSGQQGAFGADLVEFMDALEIENAVLGGFDWGGRGACIVAALWPERARGLVTGGGYNIQNIAASVKPASPEAEHRYWYQYYFHTERGRAGLAANRQAFAKQLWRLWSPEWAFDDAAFEKSAPAFDNPDFVDVVIHSYRVRFDYVAGDPAYAEIEAELAKQPIITVPTINLEGLADGVAGPPRETDYAAKRFSGPYERRLLPHTGHNPPAEAPEAFADAVLALL